MRASTSESVWDQLRTWQLPVWQCWALRAAILAAIALVLVATALRSIHQYDDPLTATFDDTHQGQFDFHNGIYYPALAFSRGDNPYGLEFTKQYPVTRQLPPYSPLMLMVHWPLAMLPIHWAERIFFALSTGLLGIIAWLFASQLRGVKDTITWGLVVMLLLVASRAGHTTLLTGYLTSELVLGMLVAIQFAERRPWLSAVGFMVVSMKPNFGIPIIVLLAARGNWRAAGAGFILATAGALAGTAMLTREIGFSRFLQDVQGAEQAHIEDDYEKPVNTWTRIDLLAVIAKWLEANPDSKVTLAVFCALIIVPSWRLLKLRKQDNSGLLSLSGTLIAVAAMSTIYHHIYDSLILVPVGLALLIHQPLAELFSTRVRWLLALGLLFVPWSYVSSKLLISVWHYPDVARQIVSSLNAVILLACLIYLVGRPSRT